MANEQHWWRRLDSSAAASVLSHFYSIPAGTELLGAHLCWVNDYRGNFEILDARMRLVLDYTSAAPVVGDGWMALLADSSFTDL